MDQRNNFLPANFPVPVSLVRWKAAYQQANGKAC